jgi:hypothetical protein
MGLVSFRMTILNNLLIVFPEEKGNISDEPQNCEYL